jgi:CheY-like chemotaxis protein
MRDSVQHTVLLVDNNPTDVFLFQRAIRKSHTGISLQRVENTEEAIKYLQGEGVYADRECYPFPSLLLTDLRMPCLNGLELLAWIKQQQHLKSLPVVVMSGSEEPRAVERTKALGAVAYYAKPSRLYELEEIFQNILSYLSPSQSE